MGNNKKQTMRFFAILAIAAAVRLSAGVSKATGKKVTEADVAACNTDNNPNLSYGEVAACLKKNAKYLGLKPTDMEAAKWGLAKAAEIGPKGLKKTLKVLKL